MAYGDDFGCSTLDAVDDTVVAYNDLANVFTVQFAHDRSGLRKIFKMLDGFVNTITPIDDGRPVLALLGDIPHTAEKPSFTSRGPADHSPSSLRIASPSTSTWRFSSA